MPLKIIRDDITRVRCDAIVNAANNSLLGGGGVDGAIHRAAGDRLLRECRKLGGCETGEAKITKGYNLPCKYVIHTVGPIWRGGDNEQELLESCYKNSLALAKKHKCESVAFPLISSGAYGYPKDEALRIATNTIGDFLLENDMLVYLVVFDKNSFGIGQELFANIAQYIDDKYISEKPYYNSESAARRRFFPRFGSSSRKKGCKMPRQEKLSEPTILGTSAPRQSSAPAVPKPKEADSAAHEDFEGSITEVLTEYSASQASNDTTKVLPRPTKSLDEMLRNIDESFSQMLLRKIDEEGITDAQCYKRANIDRKLFSKIKNNPNYKPSKPTVVAFAIALRLSLPETVNMLRKAGYALSHSSKFDIIIEYFILNGKYNIFEINDALFEFDQVTLGC